MINCYLWEILGKQDAAEATIEALKAVPDPLGKWSSILVEICSYTGELMVLLSFQHTFYNKYSLPNVFSISSKFFFHLSIFVF